MNKDAMSELSERIAKLPTYRPVVDYDDMPDMKEDDGVRGTWLRLSDVRTALETARRVPEDATPLVEVDWDMLRPFLHPYLHPPEPVRSDWRLA